MKQYYLVLLVLLGASSLAAQSSLSRSGTISFFSDAPLEKIEARNSQVIAKIDTRKGTLEFALLIKAFQFEKALMKKQFNEDYLHSDRFPEATFSGQILNLTAINFNKDGTYPVTVNGVLFLHGVKQRITEKGTLEVKDGKVKKLRSSFSVALKEYEIKTPLILKDKIAQNIQIEVDVNF